MYDYTWFYCYSTEEDTKEHSLGQSAEPSRSTSPSPSGSADLVPSLQPPPAKKRKKMSLGEEVDVALLKSLKDLEERRAKKTGA